MIFRSLIVGNAGSAGILPAINIPLFVTLVNERRWWDYPGFELWKFINLAIFVFILAFILLKKVRLGEAFRARRENIKRELARAQAERDAAVTKLKEVEERL